MAYPNIQFSITSLAATTAQDLIPNPLPNRLQVFIFNNHTTHIYLGSATSGLADTSGFPLAASQSLGPISVGFDPTRGASGGPRIFGYTTTATAAGAIRIIEAAAPL